MRDKRSRRSRSDQAQRRISLIGIGSAIESTEVQDQTSKALALADSIIGRKPTAATSGKFPQLWRQTAEELEIEYQKQKEMCEDTITLMRKTSQITRLGRDVAAANLLSLIDNMQALGQIPVDEA